VHGLVGPLPRWNQRSGEHRAAQEQCEEACEQLVVRRHASVRRHVWKNIPAMTDFVAQPPGVSEVNP
jgi:hypothetical protein